MARTRNTRDAKDLADVRSESRTLFVRLAEELARKHTLTMAAASRMVADNDAYWKITNDARGGRSKARRPTGRELRSWWPQEKRKYARLWPDELPDGKSREDAYGWLEPYLPMRLRRQTTTLQMRREIGIQLLLSGMTARAVAEAVGASLSTVYRWSNDAKTKPGYSDTVPE